VTAGRGYLVGETGPELFIPSRSGMIHPGGQLGGVTIGGTSIVIQGSATDETVQQLARLMARDRAQRATEIRHVMRLEQRSTALAT
jgi:hypothetical protein